MPPPDRTVLSHNLCMLSIYLDQNMGIGLKDAAAGRPSGERFAGLPEACRHAVSEDRCRFVLSFSHHEETHRRPQVCDRQELAWLMRSLSLGYTIAIPQEIIRHEVRSALFEVLELPGSRPTYSPFGVGADHAVGRPLIADALASISVPAESRAGATSLLELHTPDTVGGRSPRSSERPPEVEPREQREVHRSP